MKISTRLNHPPSVAVPADNRPLVAPIYQSVKFTFDSVEETERQSLGQREGFQYSRVSNPTLKQLSLTLAELQPNLHVHKHSKEWIPYRTSYYRRTWGFCMRGRDREKLRDGRYEVRIASSLAKGSLTYGEFVLPGRSAEEVLLFTHVCHPSLCKRAVMRR